MKEICNQLQQSMLKDIAELKQKQLPAIEEIEGCFQIATKYWSLVKEKLASYRFESIEEEIELFKSRKPLFTSEIEYYSLVSFAVLTQDKITDPVELSNFVGREGQRFNKFVERNRLFYWYYKNGRTDRDKEWFVKVKKESTGLQENKITPADEEIATSHDHLIATLLALERYDEYIKERLLELNNRKENIS